MVLRASSSVFSLNTFFSSALGRIEVLMPWALGSVLC